MLVCKQSIGWFTAKAKGLDGKPLKKSLVAGSTFEKIEDLDMDEKTKARFKFEKLTDKVEADFGKAGIVTSKSVGK